MKSANLHQDEESRLQEVYRYDILDSETEEDFQQLVDLASTICETPMSLVSIIDKDRQWFKARTGVDLEQSSRDISFCSHAILDDKTFVIEDAEKDNRFFDNPLVVKKPNIRFYAGVPLTSSKGLPLGTLCVLDQKPKKLTDAQISALEILGKQVMKLIELRYKNKLNEQHSIELENKNQQLERLNDLNNQISSIISHDVRGPLASILSYLNAQDFTKLEVAQTTELIDLVKRGLKSIHSLVENLLEWTQKQNSFSPQRFNLYGVVAEIYQLMESRLSEKNNTLHLDIDPKITVKADEEMIRFILRNLLSNAIKFTENGQITISAKALGNSTIISVADSGEGIAESLLDRIKKGNKKVSTTGTRKEKGSGLGLKLIRQFLQFHQSELNIDSQPGEGSIFSFSISNAEKDSKS